MVYFYLLICLLIYFHVTTAPVTLTPISGVGAWLPLPGSLYSQISPRFEHLKGAGGVLMVVGRNWFGVLISKISLSSLFAPGDRVYIELFIHIPTVEGK